jgi:thiamine-monophosphate kinase
VVSVDAHVEGVHFTRGLMTLEDAGYRATMAALSDLAAMGAAPLGVVSALILPIAMTDAELFSLARGQRDAAAEAATAVVGGNLSRGDQLSITTTVLGSVDRAVLRSGAKPGDVVWLGGPVGRAAAGLRWLRDDHARSTKTSRRTLGAVAQATSAFRRPLARIPLGRLAARAGASAMIDVSDGLVADLTHLAKASAVDVILDEEALSDPVVVELCARLGCDWRELVFHGGEDFALVATFRAGIEPKGMRRIGVCRATKKPQVLARTAGGRARSVPSLGFDHFSKA